jgi:type I restriction enzyme, S subunit
LKDIVELTVGFPFRSDDYSNDPSDVRLLRGDNVSQGTLQWSAATRWPVVDAQRFATYALDEGDVVLAMDRPWIEAGLKWARITASDIPALLVQRVARLRTDRKMDQRFMSYVIASPAFTAHVRGVQTGTAVPHISASQILSFEFQAPPIEEQEAIAATLGGLDDKIELNRKTSATLEELARALFESSFGMLDPRRLPDGWTTASLGDLVEVRRGLSYTGAGLADDGIPLHNLDSIYEGGGYKYEGIKHYQGEYKDRHIVRAGDLLVANTEQGFEYLLIGFPALVPQQFGDLSLFSHHLYNVRPKDGSWLTRRFLYLALMSPRLRQVIVGYSNGTTVNMLPADALQRPRLAVPPADLVRRFDQVVQPLFAKQEQLQLESETLAKLRDLLLPKLMSGEIRLKEAEKAVAEAG